jgi:hypothetical protein
MNRVQTIRTAKQIVSYFLRNPRAADTLEGIARWRLLDEQIDQSVRATERALQELIALGLLVARHTASAGTIYHLDESRRDEAERFLTDPPRLLRKPHATNGKRN